MSEQAQDHDPTTPGDATQEDAWLEACLAQARLDPVPDDGFTAAMMQRLPDPRRYQRRSAAPLWGAALGGLLLALQLTGAGLLPSALSGVRGGGGPALGVLLTGLLGLVALLCGWLWSEREG